MARYEVVIRKTEDDESQEIRQDADGYSIHPAGYHVFVRDGRIVRAISSAKVLEVREE